MALIKIDQLRPASSEFSADAESFMSELAEEELAIKGGTYSDSTGASGLVAVATHTLQVGLVNVNVDRSLNGNNVNVLGSQSYGCGCY